MQRNIVYNVAFKSLLKFDSTLIPAHHKVFEAAYATQLQILTKTSILNKHFPSQWCAKYNNLCLL